MNNVPTINGLAYQAYDTYNNSISVPSVAYQEFIQNESLHTAWLNVANVFTTHFAQSEPVTQSVAA